MTGNNIANFIVLDSLIVGELSQPYENPNSLIHTEYQRLISPGDDSMKTTIGWVLAIPLGLFILLVLPGVFMMGSNWGASYRGMMGGAGMMGSLGYLAPLGYFGMTLMWLVPLGGLALLVAGAIALAHSLVKPGNSTSIKPDWKCSNCGKPAQSDWGFCPACGKILQ
jgi:hypothetical protein